MPKPRRRKVEVDQELLREFLDLQRKSRETDRRIAEILADLRQFQKQLRKQYVR